MCDGHDTLRSNNTDLQQVEKQWDRRNFLTKTSLGLGALALGSLMNPQKTFASLAAGGSDNDAVNSILKNQPNEQKPPLSRKGVRKP